MKSSINVSYKKLSPLASAHMKSGLYIPSRLKAAEHNTKRGRWCGHFDHDIEDAHKVSHFNN